MFFGSKNKKDFFKFKDLKIYASTQSLAENSKMYRTVFDKSEINYLYFELSIFNKLFDEDEWETSVEFLIYEIKENNTRKEVCKLTSEKKITKDMNIVYFREGWGNDGYGSFWWNGNFEVEAYIENTLVGKKNFYIEKEGVINEKQNPYFKIKSVKLYNGESTGVDSKKRIYLSAFNQHTTKYIWCEIEIEHLLNKTHNIEIFLNFYEKSGLIKASLNQYYHIKKDNLESSTIFNNGWGSNQTGTWHKGNYSLQIMSMGSILAVVPFEIGDEDIQGIPETFFPGEDKKIISTTQNDKKTEKKEEAGFKEVSLEDAIKELNELIGLSNIKTEVTNQMNYLKFIQLRKEKGIEENAVINLNSVFTGNPGTGKTTVVNLLGKIYKGLGLLSKGHVVEVDRADLVGEYIGQTAPKTKKQIEAARGGILFIDEAYALARGGEDSKDYGKEVIEIILKEMSDGPGDIAIMVAGYPKEMNVFLNSNPGLKSRFGNYFHFEDYLPDELMEIAKQFANKKKVHFDDESSKFLYQKLTDAYRNRDVSFGNARFVTGIVNEAKQNMGLRIMQLEPDKIDDTILTTISLDDIKKIFTGDIKKKLNLTIDLELLKEATDELHQLIGMENIKKEVHEYIKLVKYYREIGKDVLHQFSLHSVFTGNPGTGKTTVARILAKIYKALGLLEKGHLIEVDRQSLVAGYVGQTAVKTKEVIDQAMGGVLFIDEAYALTNKGSNDFGFEAIEVLLKNMEDHRGKFAIIVAGYTDDMKSFLEINPGLQSRFDETFEFKDYSVDELYQIGVLIAGKEELNFSYEAAEYFKKYLEFIYEKRNKFFGNAREVRKIIEKTIRNQHIRLASMDKEKRTMAMIQTIELSDLEEFKMEDKKTGKKIGFN